jgi:Holliday junction resolvase RusA-like endonuclease
MIFAMALPKRPASAQKRGKKQRYQQEIRDAAISETGGAKLPLFNGELYVRITYFHAKKTGLDVDNIPKPILDALIGIVYDNDSQISQCLLTKVSQKDYSLEEKSFLPEVYEYLDNLLAQDHEHVLYIEVGPLLSHKVFSGPIESR